MLCVFFTLAQGRVVSMPPHPHLERLRRMLNNSETQRREVEAKLADAEAQLEESKFAIASKPPGQQNIPAKHLKSDYHRNRLWQAGTAGLDS